MLNHPLVQRGVPVPTPGVVLVSALIGFVFPLKGFRKYSTHIYGAPTVFQELG